jgi:hypothetical protein
METLSLSKASLIALLDAALYPNPDDPGDPSNPWGPYGPIGPVIGWALRQVSWVALNPQPLPPVPDPWRVAGPIPQPWRAALLARVTIDRLVAEGQSAEVATDTGRVESGHDAIRTRIAELVDEFCGNRPPRWPLPSPWPPKLDATQLHPVDLLVIGAQFQKAADSMVDNPLQADFSAAADQLLQTGVQRVESARQAAATAAR